MEAQFRSIRELFTKPGTKFEVPDYQRGFEWGKKEVRDLWLDINRIGDEVDQHYLGNIILLEKDSKKKYEIVDGQQRMTTITLLVMAIRDSQAFDNSRDRRIEDMTSSYPDGKEERRLILNDETNDSDMEYIWQKAIEEASGPIRDTYDYYRNKIKPMEDHEVDRLLNLVADNLRVVETVCRDASLAYTVFQSQNERGKEVAPHILAKSRIYGAAEKLDGDPKRVTKRWEHIYSLLTDNLGGSRWGNEELRIRRPMAQILLESETQTPMRIDKGELYRKFEQILNSYEDVHEFVTWFQEEVNTYLELTSTQYDVSGRGVPNGAVRWLQYLNASSTQAEVLSLAIYNQINEDQYPDALKEYYRLAAVIGMRMLLGGMSSTEKPDVLYSTAAKVREVEDHQAIRRLLRDVAVNETPEDGEIIEYLKSNELNYGGPWQFRTLLILVSIEENRRGPLRLDLDKLNIDHIAPRRIPESSNYARWRRQINQEDFIENRHLLGNLTLLDHPDHSSLKEESFEDKQSVYINSDIKIAEEVADYDEWTIEMIHERTERLARELTEFWNV